MILVVVAGCSKADYQKDESYECDIVGTYELVFNPNKDNKCIWYQRYELNDNNSYDFEGSFFDATSESDGKYDINNITDNLIEIKFNVDNISYNPNEEDYDAQNASQTTFLIKYKNMLGNITKVDGFPNSKTFDYIILDGGGRGRVFEADGQYHCCTNIDDCQCDYASCSGGEYIRKNNILYFVSENPDEDDDWVISFYVVDGYLFTPLLYKIS